MRIDLSDDAELDLSDGFWFYELQEIGVGDYFISSVSADIDSLVIHAGTHVTIDGYYRMVCKTFPYNVYYEMPETDFVLVAAVIPQRNDRKPGPPSG